MDTLTNDGYMGAVVLALVVYVAYLISKKKSSWAFPDLTKIAGGKSILALITEIRSVAKIWAGVALLITAVIVMFVTHSAQVTVGDVTNYSQNHWLWLLVLWGLVATTIAFTTNENEAKILQRVLIFVMVTILVVFPIWTWMTSPDRVQNVQTNVSRVGVSSRILPQNVLNLPQAFNEDGSQTDPAKWPKIHVPPYAYGDSVHVPAVPGYRHMWGGSGFEIHNVYDDGHECVYDPSRECEDGKVVAGFARNLGDVPLIASYAYAKLGVKKKI